MPSRDQTGWLTKQSTANRLGSHSLQTGKSAGKFCGCRPLATSLLSNIPPQIKGLQRHLLCDGTGNFQARIRESALATRKFGNLGLIPKRNFAISASDGPVASMATCRIGNDGSILAGDWRKRLRVLRLRRPLSDVSKPARCATRPLLRPNWPAANRCYSITCLGRII